MACLARDTTMRLPRMFRRDVPEVKPPEGFMNSGSSKYALACFGVLELVHEESVRGADCAKTQHSRFGQAERLQISFGTFLVLHKKSTRSFFFQKKKLIK